MLYDDDNDVVVIEDKSGWMDGWMVYSLPREFLKKVNKTSLTVKFINMILVTLQAIALRTFFGGFFRLGLTGANAIIMVGY